MEDLLDHNLIFEIVGGKETFEKLVNVFYSKIEKDDLIRFIFPKNLDTGRHLQGLFLAQKFGGPRDYEKIRGHARLRKRHFKFPIGIPERNRWVELMLKAMREVGIDESHRAWSTLKEYFERVATKMINKSEDHFRVL